MYKNNNYYVFDNIKTEEFIKKIFRIKKKLIFKHLQIFIIKQMEEFVNDDLNKEVNNFYEDYKKNNVDFLDKDDIKKKKKEDFADFLDNTYEEEDPTKYIIDLFNVFLLYYRQSHKTMKNESIIDGIIERKMTNNHTNNIINSKEKDKLNSKYIELIHETIEEYNDIIETEEIEEIKLNNITVDLINITKSEDEIQYLIEKKIVSGYTELILDILGKYTEYIKNLIDDYNENIIKLEITEHKNVIMKIIREYNKNIKISYEKENLTNKYTEEFKKIIDEYNENSTRDKKLIEVFDVKNMESKDFHGDEFENLYGIAIDDDINLISASLFSLIIKINENYENPYEINWIIVKIK
jgi:hypothetical protein